MKDASLLETPPPKLEPSPLRAWLYVVRAAWQRQARAQLMVWIAAGLVLFLTLMVALTTRLGVWDVRTWRRSGPNSPTKVIGTFTCGSRRAVCWSTSRNPSCSNRGPAKATFG